MSTTAITEYRATPAKILQASYSPIVTEPDDVSTTITSDNDDDYKDRISKAALVAIMPLTGPVCNPNLGKTHPKKVLLNEAFSGKTDYMIVYYPHTFEVPLVTVWAKGTDGTWFPWKIIGLEQNIGENYKLGAHYSSLLMFKGNTTSIGSTVLNGQFTTIYTKTIPDLRTLEMSQLTRLRDEDSSVVANESIMIGAVIVPELPTMDTVRGLWEGNSNVRTITEGQCSKNYFFDYADSSPSNSPEWVANPGAPFNLFDTNRGVLPYELTGNTEITMDLEIISSYPPGGTQNNPFVTISIYYRSGIDTYTQEEFSTGIGNGGFVVPSPLLKKSTYKRTTRKIKASDFETIDYKIKKRDPFSIDLSPATEEHEEEKEIKLKDLIEKKDKKKDKEVKEKDKDKEKEKEKDDFEDSEEEFVVKKKKDKTETAATNFWIYNGSCKFTVYTPYPIERITVAAFIATPVIGLVGDYSMNAHMQLKNWSCVNDGPMMPVAITIIENTDPEQTIRINGFFNLNLVPKDTTIPDIKMSYDPNVSILDVDWARRLSAGEIIKNVYTQPEYFNLVSSGALYEICKRKNHQGFAASFGARIKDIINRAISGGIKVSSFVGTHGPQFMSGVNLLSKVLTSLQKGDAKDVATLLPQIYKMFNSKGMGMAAAESSQEFAKSLDSSLIEFKKYDDDDIDAPRKMRSYLYANYGRPVNLKKLIGKTFYGDCKCVYRYMNNLHHPHITMSGCFRIPKKNVDILRLLLDMPKYYSDEDINKVVDVYPCEFWAIYCATTTELPELLRKLITPKTVKYYPDTILKFGVTMRKFNKSLDLLTGTYTQMNTRAERVKQFLDEIPEDGEGNSKGYAASVGTLDFTKNVEEMPEVSFDETELEEKQQTEFMEYSEIIQNGYIQLFPIIFKQKGQAAAVLGAVTVTALPLNFRINVNRSEGKTSYSKQAIKPIYRKVADNKHLDTNLNDYGQMFELLPENVYVTLVSVLNSMLTPIKGESWCMAASISAMAMNGKAPEYQVAYSGSLIINDKIGVIYGPAEFIQAKAERMYDDYGLYTLASYIEKDFVYAPVQTQKYLYHCITPNAVCWWHSTAQAIGINSFVGTSEPLDDEEIERLKVLPGTDTILKGLLGVGKKSSERSKSQSARAARAYLNKYDNDDVELPPEIERKLTYYQIPLAQEYAVMLEKKKGGYVTRKRLGKEKQVKNTISASLIDHWRKTIEQYEAKIAAKEQAKKEPPQKMAPTGPMPKFIYTVKGKVDGNQFAYDINEGLANRELANSRGVVALIQKKPKTVPLIIASGQPWSGDLKERFYIGRFQMNTTNVGWCTSMYVKFYPNSLSISYQGFKPKTQTVQTGQPTQPAPVVQQAQPPQTQSLPPRTGRSRERMGEKKVPIPSYDVKSARQQQPWMIDPQNVGQMLPTTYPGYLPPVAYQPQATLPPVAYQPQATYQPTGYQPYAQYPAPAYYVPEQPVQQETSTEPSETESYSEITSSAQPPITTEYL